jgi:hypothetical protein
MEKPPVLVVCAHEFQEHAVAQGRGRAADAVLIAATDDDRHQLLFGRTLWPFTISTADKPLDGSAAPLMDGRNVGFWRKCDLN